MSYASTATTLAFLPESVLTATGLVGMSSSVIAPDARHSETPLEFLRRVFARYRQIDSWQKDYVPWHEFADRGLSYLIDRNSYLYGLQGDVGFLDSDPICDCQDYSPEFKPIISGRFLSTSEFLAVVTYDKATSPLPPYQLLLRKLNGRWLVYDRPKYNGKAGLKDLLIIDNKKCELARRLHPTANEPCS